MRKDRLVNNHYYHVLNRSIAQYEIFKDVRDCERFLRLLDLYRYIDFDYKYSHFLELTLDHQKNVIKDLKSNNSKLVKIISYCLMPTHLHLILYQNVDSGISKFIARILNSYSRYFNLYYHRKGPMWEGHFKNILITTDEQLLHLTRYIHLNPVSANLVKKPEDWQLSSYLEYVRNGKDDNICEFDGLFNLSSKDYKNFVNSGISYQKELAKIKHLLIENYNG